VIALGAGASASRRRIRKGETVSTEPSTAPQRSGLVLGALIAVAAVANLGLAVANVALPSIGKHFDASQTELNLVAVGYSLGLAASVLYFGASATATDGSSC
jgi:MFS family permease